jgi:hypothetical protein
MSSRISSVASTRLFRKTHDSDAYAPIGLEHEEDLKALLDMLRATVQLELKCDYDEPSSAPQQNRSAFQAHFGGSGDLLDEWDERVQRARAAPGTLWYWFERAAAELGLAEPAFAVGALIDRLATCTLERARRGCLSTPHKLYLQHFKDRFDGREYMSIYVEGQKIAKLSCGAPSGDISQQIEAADRRIQQLFDDAQSCPEAAEIENARDSLLDLKHLLLDRLVRYAAVTPILVTSDCPFCQQQPELDV